MAGKQDDLSQAKATISRPNGKAKSKVITPGMTVADLAKAAEMSLNKGEIFERDGKVVKGGSKVNPGDVIIITKDFTNGPAKK